MIEQLVDEFIEKLDKLWSKWQPFLDKIHWQIVFPALAVVFLIAFVWWSLLNLMHGVSDIGVGETEERVLTEIPFFDLPELPDSDIPRLNYEMLIGKVSLVNFWASWCISCHNEHHLLMELAENEIIHLVGINYKDDPDNARRYLNTQGNPFESVGWDSTGKVGIEWGIYGQPETFLISTDGVIRYRHIGPLTRQVVRNRVIPKIKEIHSEYPVSGN